MVSVRSPPNSLFSASIRRAASTKPRVGLCRGYAARTRSGAAGEGRRARQTRTTVPRAGTYDRPGAEPSTGRCRLDRNHEQRHLQPRPRRADVSPAAILVVNLSTPAHAVACGSASTSAAARQRAAACRAACARSPRWAAQKVTRASGRIAGTRARERLDQDPEAPSSGQRARAHTEQRGSTQGELTHLFDAPGDSGAGSPSHELEARRERARPCGRIRRGEGGATGPQ
jgi:hypothetical protein